MDFLFCLVLVSKKTLFLNASLAVMLSLFIFTFITSSAEEFYSRNHSQGWVVSCFSTADYSKHSSSLPIVLMAKFNFLFFPTFKTEELPSWNYPWVKIKTFLFIQQWFTLWPSKLNSPTSKDVHRDEQIETSFSSQSEISQLLSWAQVLKVLNPQSAVGHLARVFTWCRDLLLGLQFNLLPG